MESQYASLPSYNGEDLELTVNDNGTHFRLWSPQAEAARVYLYNTDCKLQAQTAVALLLSILPKPIPKAGAKIVDLW